ncbi:MAG: M48 family metallopeptidase [Desulfobacterales bacterium]|nr:M48 family metallopeptidase [Desulfobacterales bacterium]
MNWIGWVILAGIVCETSIRVVADLLNLQRAGTVPKELQGLYSQEESQKAAAYLKARTAFGHIHSFFFLGLFLLFWFFKGFPIVDKLVTTTPLHPVWQGVFALFTLGAAKGLFDLPFSWYSTFVIEEGFGFNRTTKNTFITDRLKGLAIGILLGTPLLAGVLYFFHRFGPSGWIACWAVVVAYTTCANMLVPILILPLFNRYAPLPEGELKDRILDYAKRIQFPVKNIFLMDGSKRSSKANAFFIGTGRFRRIVLFDTLVDKQSHDEVMAVLAHEMGHAKCHHIKVNWLLSILHTGALFYLLSFCLEYLPLHHAFFMEETKIYTGLIFFSLLWTPVGLLLDLPIQALSRKHEFQADAFAAKTTGLGESLASSLKGLSKSSLANLSPHPFFVALNHSHPPVAQRIRRLQTLK